MRLKLLFLSASIFSGTLLSAPAPAQDLLSPVTEKISALKSALETEGDPRERARLYLLTGDPDAARTTMDAWLEDHPPETPDPLDLEICFALHDYAGIESRVGYVRAPGEPDLIDLLYRWLRVIDDLAGIQILVEDRAAARLAEPADYRARGFLAVSTFDYDAAGEWYEKALERSQSAVDSARAMQGLGDVASRRRDFDAAYEHILRALPLSDPDPGLLMDLATTLIRLGRTDEAISAAELAVRIAPYDERAHYYLGNGYARKNYTQLFEAYPQAFLGLSDMKALGAADALQAEGKLNEAEAAYAKLNETGEWADVLTRLGSLDYMKGDYASARVRFTQALGVCPEYGRAHNGLAKAVEGERLAVEVFRPKYEEAFAAAEMPSVPGIEEFVVNWDSLSPRHRKRVALSVEPWKRFIPVLVESGSTYYIKPLHELLSETPGQETLRDQRISYDSRLWDDVRGCGGYNTVTGVEDVERTIQNRYNTVLHELTHQVHGVLPGDRKRQIQELYRRTKDRQEAGEDAFLSRYAGGSVWEYFAEGANALESPKRDRWDTRDIVLERLEEKDRALENLVLDLMNEADVESCYVVGYTNRGDDRLEKGSPKEAIAAYHLALARDPNEESALGSLAFALCVVDSADKALSVAEESTARDPRSATLAVGRSTAMWLAGKDLEEAAAWLEQARSGVREGERYEVDLALGNLRWNAGHAEEAKAAYSAVLEYQSDNPEGLWGLATSLALEENWEAAWEKYEEAVRVRTGVVGLRCDYARDLLRAGELDEAKEQIDAALLLDDGDPRVLALSAWLALARGNAAEAAGQARAALEKGEWCDLARIVLTRALEEQGDAAAADAALEPLRARLESHAPPEYVYRAKWGRYDMVHTLPKVERDLIEAGS